MIVTEVRQVERHMNTTSALGVGVAAPASCFSAR